MKIFLPSLAVLLSISDAVLGQGQLVGFTLIDAATDLAIGAVENGDTIDLSTIGAQQLSMRADTSGTVGSVKLELDGQPTATESVWPYALGGDSGGNYNPVPGLLVATSHTVVATIFSGSGGSGIAGDSLSITFYVTDNSPPSPTGPPIEPPSSDSDVDPYPSSPQGTVSGELLKWHKISLGFEGPSTSETDFLNPFTDYRLDVVFEHDGMSATIPGYYAADGNAANSKATSGNVWLAHFAPNASGTWTWTAQFTTGTKVAQNGGGVSAGFFDGATGLFEIGDTDKSGRDFRGKGRLEYVGKHHLQFAEMGEYFLKAGADL